MLILEIIFIMNDISILLNSNKDKEIIDENVNIIENRINYFND